MSSFSDMRNLLLFCTTVKASVTKWFWLFFVRKLQFQESRLPLQRVPKVWFRPDRWIRVFSGVQSAQTGHNIVGKCSSITSHYLLSPKNNLWPNWSTLYASEALLISISLFRHDSSFCKTSSWNKYDYQCSDGSYFLRHGHRISQWNFDILSPPMLQEYADVIHAKGAPLNNCFGFFDGTARPISRPGQHQRMVYNSHKRVHSLKFQSVALPNGLIGNMYGPAGKLCSLRCHNK